MKFHEIHGANIRLSADGSEALLADLGDGLCFTHRPLRAMENLFLRIFPVSRVPGGGLRVGISRNDPYKLQGKLPQYLREGQPGESDMVGKSLTQSAIFFGSPLDFVLPEDLMQIYLDTTLGCVMVSSRGENPQKLYGGISPDNPVYLVFDLFVNTQKIHMMSIVIDQRPCAPPPPRSRSFPSFILRPVCFSGSNSSKVRVQPQLAASADTSSSDANFALVDTLLEPNHALIVEFTVLKQATPVRIILKDARPAVRDQNHSTTSRGIFVAREFVLYSEIPTAGEELALGITQTGEVGVNHGGRGWVQRLTVNPAFRYHVFFDMQNISVLSMVGMTTGQEHIDSAVSPGILSAKESRVLPDCVVCLENPRTTALMPCFHFAVCEDCLRLLKRSKRLKCPICRKHVLDTHKVYIS